MLQVRGAGGLVDPGRAFGDITISARKELLVKQS